MPGQTITVTQEGILKGIPTYDPSVRAAAELPCKLMNCRSKA
jgi:hypothetical protein